MKNWMRKWLGISNIESRMERVESTHDSVRQSIRDIRFGPECVINTDRGQITNGEAIKGITDYLQIKLEYTNPVKSKITVKPVGAD